MKGHQLQWCSVRSRRRSWTRCGPMSAAKKDRDGCGAYRRHLDPRRHVVGKRRTQQLERKHLTLRTRIKRLVRRTICFSKSTAMHEIIIGLFVNRYEFGLPV